MKDFKGLKKKKKHIKFKKNFKNFRRFKNYGKTSVSSEAVPSLCLVLPSHHWSIALTFWLLANSPKLNCFEIFTYRKTKNKKNKKTKKKNHF
jgi:hypothetical protein